MNDVNDISNYNQHVHSIIENSSHLFYLLNKDLEFTYLSKHATTIFECTPDATPKSFKELFTTDLCNKRAIEIANIAFTTCKEQHSYEIELLTHKGTNLWLEIQETPIVENGKTILLAGVAIDITKRKWAERALKVSEKKYRDMVTRAPIGIFQATKYGKLLSANYSLAEMLGYGNEEDIIGCELSKDIYYDENDWKNIANQNAYKTNNVFISYETRWKKRDGSIVWAHVNVNDVRDKKNQILYFEGFVFDITTRKYAEEELQQERNILRTVIDNLPALIFFKDTKGRYLLNNRPHLLSLGAQKQEDVLGKTVYDFNPPDFAESYNKDDMDVIKNGTPLYDKEELAIHRDTGKSHWHLSTKVPLTNNNGEVIGVVGISRDITDKKLTAEALRQSEERYRLLVENTTDIVTELSPEGIFLYVSPNIKTILHFEPSEIIGTSIFSRLYKKEKDSVLSLLKNFGGSTTYRFKDKLGDWHWFESAGKIYKTASGEIRMVMVSRDITERRKAEQELDASRMQLQHFTEHLEHVLEEERKRISRELHDELGQLLTILKFDLSWIRLEGEKCGTEVKDKIDGMMDLLNEALASVKRISKEIRPPQLDALGIGGALQWDIEQVEKKIGIKGTVTIDPKDFELKGQISTVLYRIFREALTNIVRHAQAKHVYVRLNKKDDKVILTVQDDGRGITKRELKGKTSLGLVGIRERVRMVGGKLKIEGKPGKGTMLCVEVPLEKIKNRSN